MNPDKAALLKQLRTMNGSVFENHLKSLLGKTDQQLRRCGREEVLNLQGRAQLLEELLNDIATARVELDRLERPAPNMSKAF